MTLIGPVRLVPICGIYTWWYTDRSGSSGLSSTGFWAWGLPLSGGGQSGGQSTAGGTRPRPFAPTQFPLRHQCSHAYISCQVTGHMKCRPRQVAAGGCTTAIQPGKVAPFTLSIGQQFHASFAGMQTALHCTCYCAACSCCTRGSADKMCACAEVGWVHGARCMVQVLQARGTAVVCCVCVLC